MPDSLVDEVWDDLVERLDDDLRVVTTYDVLNHETRMREDVRERYTPEEDREVVDDTILKHLSASGSERAFKTGELHGLVRIFDDAWVLSWAAESDEKVGVIVSVDRDGDVATLDDLDWCVEYLNEAVAPELT